MIRPPLLILPLAALAALPGAALAQTTAAPAAVPAPSPETLALFSRRYADLRSAMEKGEAEGIEAILTPDFTSTDRRGETRTVDDVISMSARMAMMGDPGGRKSTTTIASIAMNGDGADIEQTTDTTMSRAGRDGQTHKLEMIATSDDHWVNQKGVWRLQKQTPKAMKIMRDGVEMKPGEGPGRGGRGGPGGPPPGDGAPPPGDGGPPPPPPGD